MTQKGHIGRGRLIGNAYVHWHRQSRLWQAQRFLRPAVAASRGCAVVAWREGFPLDWLGAGQLGCGNPGRLLHLVGSLIAVRRAPSTPAFYALARRCASARMVDVRPGLTLSIDLFCHR